MTLIGLILEHTTWISLRCLFGSSPAKQWKVGRRWIKSDLNSKATSRLGYWLHNGCSSKSGVASSLRVRLLAAAISPCSSWLSWINSSFGCWWESMNSRILLSLKWFSSYSSQFWDIHWKRKPENKLIKSDNKNKIITNKLKGAISGNNTKILRISKLNILINPWTKNNKLLGKIEARVESSGIGF